MECSKCQGFLVIDELTDFLSSPSGDLWKKVTRCVNCGNIEDPAIRKNRQLSHYQALSSLKVECVVG